MVSLAALHEVGKKNAEALECHSFLDQPFSQPKPLSESKVVLISSAGLIQRGDKPFRGGDAGYREFPDSLHNEDILVSHISINFDRSAALKNIESIFPRRILAEMAADGEVAGIADTHFSFMGATDPAEMEDNAAQLAQTLRAQGVDTAVFLPV